MERQFNNNMAVTMNADTSAILLFLAFLLGTSPCRATRVSVLTSYVDEVPKFSTAVVFNIELKNSGDHAENATIVFDRCCWDIEQDDRDCEIMLLRPAAVAVQFQPQDVHIATFMHYNLYPRYRQGDCYFTVRTQGEGSSTWHHTLAFNTAPKINDTQLVGLCEGRDQDPDRSCSPVDCAVKYGGRRNFYSNSTGRCKVVTPCNTRGEDGISVVAYYDRETNLCHRLDWLDDNEIEQIESDFEIITTINASEATYFPGFEPTKFSKEDVTLSCNYGHQTGIYCTCDEGWQSSGLDPRFPTVYHWCDQETVLPDYALHRRPTHFGKIFELFAISILAIVNVVLSTAWIYIFTVLLFLTNETWSSKNRARSLFCSPINFCALRCCKKGKGGLVYVDSSEE